jgi:hypothetical protein
MLRLTTLYCPAYFRTPSKNGILKLKSTKRVLTHGPEERGKELLCDFADLENLEIIITPARPVEV